ncbi:MAG: hypothetical protein R6X13_10505 [bacterium]
MSRALPCILLFVAACSSGDPAANPNYSEPLVFAYIYRVEYSDRTVEYDRDVQVYDGKGLRSVPVVELNGERLQPYSYRPTEYRYGDQAPCVVERLYSLTVNHYWGEAFARAVMPGNFAIVAPRARYVHARDSVLHVAWSPSTAAQWYWVEVYADYDYNDSSGSWDSYSFSYDTLLTSTSLDLPPEWVFPGFVAELLEGDGSIVIWAGAGPAIEPGDIGNVKGAGFGFFNGINEPAERYFYVGAPPCVRRVPPPGPARRSRGLARLRSRAAAIR